MANNNTLNAQEKQKLFATLWNVANDLRGAMTADNFRDYMLSLLFMRYLSENYEKEAEKILGSDFPTTDNPLKTWCDENAADVPDFQAEMQRSLHYIIDPQYLWNNIYELARTQSQELLDTLQKAFKYIENESFESSLQGLFSEINLASEKLGKDYSSRNAMLCKVISTLEEHLVSFSKDYDILGDAYEYLIGQFAANAGQKAGEFYTPQQISTILSRIVILDSQDPTTGPQKSLNSVLDFACGSGSLLLNVKKQMEEAGGKIGRIYGQEKNITTYNLARMNMLLHGFNYLSDSGTMAIILPHGVLFRSGAEERIRTKLIDDKNIDCIIGLPSNLFFSTGIPVCIIVLKKCRSNDDVLFINAAELFEKGKKQNILTDKHIETIVETYKNRTDVPRLSRKVSLKEIQENGYNLNITRYVSLAQEEEPIDLEAVHTKLADINSNIVEARAKHNQFLKELGVGEI